MWALCPSQWGRRTGAMPARPLDPGPGASCPPRPGPRLTPTPHAVLTTHSSAAAAATAAGPSRTEDGPHTPGAKRLVTTPHASSGESRRAPRRPARVATLRRGPPSSTNANPDEVGARGRWQPGRRPELPPARSGFQAAGAAPGAGAGGSAGRALTPLLLVPQPDDLGFGVALGPAGEEHGVPRGDVCVLGLRCDPGPFCDKKHRPFALTHPGNKTPIQTRVMSWSQFFKLHLSHKHPPRKGRRASPRRALWGPTPHGFLWYRDLGWANSEMPGTSVQGPCALAGRKTLCGPLTPRAAEWEAVLSAAAGERGAASSRRAGPSWRARFCYRRGRV